MKRYHKIKQKYLLLKAGAMPVIKVSCVDKTISVPIAFCNDCTFFCTSMEGHDAKEVILEYPFSSKSLENVIDLWNLTDVAPELLFLNFETINFIDNKKLLTQIFENIKRDFRNLTIIKLMNLLDITNKADIDTIRNKINSYFYDFPNSGKNDFYMPLCIAQHDLIIARKDKSYSVRYLLNGYYDDYTEESVSTSWSLQSEEVELYLDKITHIIKEPEFYYIPTNVTIELVHPTNIGILKFSSYECLITYDLFKKFDLKAFLQIILDAAFSRENKSIYKNIPIDVILTSW